MVGYTQRGPNNETRGRNNEHFASAGQVQLSRLVGKGFIQFGLQMRPGDAKNAFGTTMGRPTMIDLGKA